MAKEHSRVHAAMGGSKKESGSKSKSKSGKVHRMHIRRSANGGFIAEHHFKAEKGKEADVQEPEEHQVSDIDQLKQHLEEHMGDQEAAPQAAPAGPPAPAAAPMPGM